MSVPCNTAASAANCAPATALLRPANCAAAHCQLGQKVPAVAALEAVARAEVLMDESASREEEKAWRESFVGLRVALPDYQGGGQGVIKAVVGQVVHVVVGDDNKGWNRNAETIVTSHLDELEEVTEEGK